MRKLVERSWLVRFASRLVIGVGTAILGGILGMALLLQFLVADRRPSPEADPGNASAVVELER